ncbi:MAG: hydrogenase iron-sulfur subunit [Anaerolineae bacterium]|nr:hydrogenase iron-sulfur subunit [Anaerolineae bacterium]
MEREPKFVIFTCNWNAHESLQEAGKQRLHYPAGARPLKVDCLGQVSASVILKAFEKGADGVMLVGCSPQECHYEFGSRRAAELFAEIRKLSKLLGFREEQLAFHQVHAGDSEALIEQVRSFAARLTAISPPLRGGARGGETDE